MKKILTFIPLGVAISAAIIYVFNVISFKAINNTVAMAQILASLRIYLLVSIIAFIIYVLIKILFYINDRKNGVVYEKEIVEKPVIKKQEKKVIFKTVEENIKQEPVIVNTVKKEDTENIISEDIIDFNKDIYDDNKVVVENKATIAYEPFETVKETNYVLREDIKEEKISIFKNYCPHCGKEVLKDDFYCRNCGHDLRIKNNRKKKFIRKIINVIEIVIMILIIYFVLNMIFDYKAKIEPNFKSPFKINVLK